MNIGLSGYSWATSSAGTGSINGSYLNTNLNNVNPYNLNNRSFGLQVRCVQVSTKSKHF